MPAYDPLLSFVIFQRVPALQRLESVAASGELTVSVLKWTFGLAGQRVDERHHSARQPMLKLLPAPKIKRLFCLVSRS